MGTFRFSDSIELFHDRASTQRALSDFGEDDYSEALDVLCHSLDEDASLTPIGEFTFQAMITDALEARLLCEAGWRDSLGARSTQIERPLIIVGLPRTGTTALHHLLAQAPEIQTLEHWIQRAPQPRPPQSDWHTDPNFITASARLDLIFSQSPELRAIHEIEARLPDECWNTLSQNFSHCSYEANSDVTQYAEWWSQADMRPAYLRHRRNAQLIGSNEPEKRWLFKDATHLFNLDALLEVYPDAMIIQTHRDPIPVIASVCSLCSASRASLNSKADPYAFGRSTLSLWERSIESMMEARRGYDPKQFYDLSFDRIVTDPRAAIREIFTYFDIEYTQAADQSIAKHRGKNPKDKHGAHHYTLGEWGLREDEVRERFRVYTDTYLDA